MSDAPQQGPVAKKYESKRELEEARSDEQKKEEVSCCIHLICSLRFCLQSSIIILKNCNLVSVSNMAFTETDSYHELDFHVS